MQAVQSLFIVYDPDCGLCARVKTWILSQRALVAVEFVPARSEAALRRFPGLPAGELAVVSDSGDVWLGNHAWIVCLWALRDYRDWSLRLSSPLLRLMAREAFAAVSNNRHSLSTLLRLKSDRELEQQLRKVNVTACQPTKG